MLRLVSFLALSALIQTGYAQNVPEAANVPASPGVCQSLCKTAREQCRSEAQGATETDTNPVLSMKPSSNPYAAAAKDIVPASQELRPTEAQAFRARRAERLQVCEATFRSCTRPCN